MALGRSVQYSSTVVDHLVPFSELTSTRTTYPDYHYCPCTLGQANSWVRVDLGRWRKISRVDLTASFQLRETHFRTVNIHIGDTGDWQNDPIVGGKDATTPGELEVLKFDVTGTGRYLTLVQQEDDYFCICKIQAYGY
ncbi:uncharacterized protein [Macrobrachium rosenbergii]|uniref:uncharacterized protein n=1 Tax=Macrobrachium rosenbergii TaxID=79674 RepID=UPI0034D79ED6